MASRSFWASELEWEPRHRRRGVLPFIYGASPLAEGADFFDDVS